MSASLLQACCLAPLRRSCNTLRRFVSKKILQHLEKILIAFNKPALWVQNYQSGTALAILVLTKKCSCVELDSLIMSDTTRQKHFQRNKLIASASSSDIHQRKIKLPHMVLRINRVVSDTKYF